MLQINISGFILTVWTGFISHFARNGPQGVGQHIKTPKGCVFGAPRCSPFNKVYRFKNMITSGMITMWSNLFHF